MAEPRRARVEGALDDVSDHLGVVLQRADELLVQWSAFGAAVRGQVEREAGVIGEAVAGAVDAAVARASAGGVERAITDQVGARLAALTAEIAKLEARTRAAARAVTDERTGDRRLLWVVIGGIVLANVLLAAILLRKPAMVLAPAPAEPVKVEPAEPPGVVPAPAATAAGSAVELQADAPSSNAPPLPVKESGPRTGAPVTRPPGAPVTRPPGASSNGLASGSGAPAERDASAQSGGASSVGGHAAPGAQTEHAGSAQGSGAAGARAAPAAKLPPRTPPQKK